MRFAIKGFIPWDDDMDICMLREDYEKLQDYLIANPDERYEVMSYKNNLNLRLSLHESAG